MHAEDKKTSAKERIEAIDDENKTISYSLFDGEVDKCYKSLKVTLQVKDKENGGGGLVKWTIEYEKLEENIKGAAPETYLDFAAKVTKDIDAHLLKA
ncbi:MLP-like protein 43 [Senna tora]|uniref:MLP-like protein 43 n=1 Tax=Senna tora TaxID=362788 RepID=A0A834SQG0_9FABA|nr:MLP-like protein 43 [Senna tora]